MERSRAHAIVLGAFALLALHVVDDSFLQPRPGTAAGDHLVSGLVPLAVLVVAVAVFSRARPGAQAAIAGVAGILALTAGGVDLHENAAKIGRASCRERV